LTGCSFVFLPSLIVSPRPKKPAHPSLLVSYSSSQEKERMFFFWFQ